MGLAGIGPRWRPKRWSSRSSIWWSCSGPTKWILWPRGPAADRGRCRRRLRRTQHPVPHPTDTRHPVADRDDIHLVHVTHFNRMNWDNGAAPATVIEHGIATRPAVDRGHRPPGDRHQRTDQAGPGGRRGPVAAVRADRRSGCVRDVGDRRGARYGIPPIDAASSRTCPRAPCIVSWPGVGSTSTRAVDVAGALLLEAMHLGMPVVVLAATEAPGRCRPRRVCRSDLTELIDAVGHLHWIRSPRHTPATSPVPSH